jgi:hypothetical protein
MAHPPEALPSRTSTLARPILRRELTVVGLSEASLETPTLTTGDADVMRHPHSPLAQPAEEADREKIR